MAALLRLCRFVFYPEINNMLMPDYYFNRITDIPTEFFEQNGIEGLLLDVDGTLTPDGVVELTDDVLSWLERAKEAGVRMSIVSNNHEQRVKNFADRYGFSYVYEAKKPLAGSLERSLASVKGTRENTALIGDQIFTDIWYAKNCRIRSILVDPMAKDIYPFVKFKRIFEGPIRRAVHRKFGKH